MLNSRSLHGIKVIAYIASAPSYQPVATGKLSKLLELSVSYVESLMKELRDGGLVVAYRGPGGGYLLQVCVEELSAWEVAKCFEKKEASSEIENYSQEGTVFSIIKEEFDEIRHHFLQNFPLAQIIKNVPKNLFTTTTSESLPGRFKPLVKDVLPNAPNSVFDLHNFVRQLAA